MSARKCFSIYSTIQRAKKHKNAAGEWLPPCHEFLIKREKSSKVPTRIVNFVTTCFNKGYTHNIPRVILGVVNIPKIAQKKDKYVRQYTKQQENISKTTKRSSFDKEGNAEERFIAFSETRLRSFINYKPACILLACTSFATPKRELWLRRRKLQFP